MNRIQNLTSQLKTNLNFNWLVAALVALLGLSAQNAQAFPRYSMVTSQWQLQPTQVPFNGIVALDGCSGSIIRLNNNLKLPALVMTNGHCLDNMVKPGQFVSNSPDRRDIKIFNAEDQRIRAQTVRIVYGTMTGTDVAIFELNETYEQLLAKGIKSYTLSNQPVPVGTEILLVSGYFHSINRCQVQRFAYILKEDAWTWNNSYMYKGCKSIHGTSGSPLIAAQTGEVIGINNTGSDSGERCTFNNPCEVDPNGQVTYAKGNEYGQQVYPLLGCQDQSGRFNLAVPTCKVLGGAGYQGFVQFRR